MSTEIDNHAFQNLLFFYLKDLFLFLLIKFSNILSNLSIVIVRVIQAFPWLFWKKTHEFKMTNWQMLAFQFLTFLLISRIFTSYGFVSFLSILLHTNQLFRFTITSIYMGFKKNWIHLINSNWWVQDDGWFQILLSNNRSP